MPRPNHWGILSREPHSWQYKIIFRTVNLSSYHYFVKIYNVLNSYKHQRNDLYNTKVMNDKSIYKYFSLIQCIRDFIKAWYTGWYQIYMHWFLSSVSHKNLMAVMCRPFGFRECKFCSRSSNEGVLCQNHLLRHHYPHQQIKKHGEH